MKKTGLAGIFSASLELTKEGEVQLLQKKIFEKIEFFIQTIEVESNGDNQLLTIRFILVGDLKINEMEDIGVAFRNQILTEFGGNLFLKLNKQVDPLDFIITISPLQLINHKETSLFPDWLIQKVIIGGKRKLAHYTRL